jgi:hypothetical protein
MRAKDAGEGERRGKEGGRGKEGELSRGGGRWGRGDGEGSTR